MIAIVILRITDLDTVIREHGYVYTPLFKKLEYQIVRYIFVKEVEPSSSGRSKIEVTDGVMTSQKSGSQKLHTREGASAAYQDTINGNAHQSQRCELRRAVANDAAGFFC